MYLVLAVMVTDGPEGGERFQSPVEPRLTAFTLNWYWYPSIRFRIRAKIIPCFSCTSFTVYTGPFVNSFMLFSLTSTW